MLWVQVDDGDVREGEGSREEENWGGEGRREAGAGWTRWRFRDACRCGGGGDSTRGVCSPPSWFAVSYTPPCSRADTHTSGRCVFRGLKMVSRELAESGERGRAFGRGCL